MSDQITLAIERAAQAMYETTFAGHYTDDKVLREVHEGLAYAAFASLDVEDIARAIHASDFPDDDWDQEVHTGLRDECLKNARAVRAHLLGGAA